MVNSGVVIGKVTGAVTVNGASAAASTASVTGTTVATGASAASAGTAAGGGFLTTVAGKVVVAVTAICVGVGSAAVGTEVRKIEMQNDYGHVITYEEAAEMVAESNNFLFSYNEPVSTPIPPISTPEPAIATYQHVEDFLGIEENDLEGIDEEYLCALDALAQQLIRYQEALEYSLTDEQYTYIDQIMSAYLTGMSTYLMQGQQFTVIGEADATGVFMDEYMPDYVNFLYREADIMMKFADIYSKEEVKNAFANHSVAELQEMLNLGGGAGDLIINEISEETAGSLYGATQDFFELIDDMNSWANRVMSDPELSGYFQ